MMVIKLEGSLDKLDLARGLLRGLSCDGPFGYAELAVIKVKMVQGPG